MKLNLGIGYVFKRWIVVMLVFMIVFVLVVLAFRLFDNRSTGVPARGLENQADVIEGRAKEPKLNDANSQPQTNVGGIEEYRRFESSN